MSSFFWKGMPLYPALNKPFTQIILADITLS